MKLISQDLNVSFKVNCISAFSTKLLDPDGRGMGRNGRSGGKGNCNLDVVYGKNPCVEL